MEQVSYNKAALQAYMEQAENVRVQMQRRQDESVNLYYSCKQKYERMYTQFEEVARSAYNQMGNAESMQRCAELELEYARRSAENESDRNSAVQRMQRAQTMWVEANEEYVKASGVYSKACKDLQNISTLWNEYASSLELQVRRIEENRGVFLRLVANGNSDLNPYIGLMEKIQDELQNGYNKGEKRSDSIVTKSGINSASGQQEEGINVQSQRVMGTSMAIQAKDVDEGSRTKNEKTIIPVGWGHSNSMTAVHIDKNGDKMVTIVINGTEGTYRCTMSGMAKAYRYAQASGDRDMIARTSAMFEIERLRESLDLGMGDAAFFQMGGYHKDVKEQDPKGYESHHIPSQRVQEENGKMLPTVSITLEDHKLTSSYTGKQRKKYSPVLPSTDPAKNHRDSVIEHLAQGGVGYIDSIKNELLELREVTGHRYDGGISAYLDAVIDLLSTHGIPKARCGDKK